MRRVLAGLLLLLCVSPLSAAEGLFESNGIKLHYTDEGQGEAVVLVHGFAATKEIQWGLPGITKQLAKGYRVIAYDGRGHGRSSKPEDVKQYGLEMARDVIRLMDQLKISKAHLVGYSMGSFVVLKVMTLYPDRVLTATLGGAGWEKTEDAKFLDDLAKDIEQGKGITLLFQRLTPPGRPKPQAEHLTQVNQMFKLFNDPKAMAAVIRSMIDLAVTEDALKSCCSIPTCALVGDLDPLKKGIDDLQGRLKDYQIQVIKGADHFDAFSRPEFIKGLLEFLGKKQQLDQRSKAADSR